MLFSKTESKTHISHLTTAIQYSIGSLVIVLKHEKEMIDIEIQQKEIKLSYLQIILFFYQKSRNIQKPLGINK